MSKSLATVLALFVCCFALSDVGSTQGFGLPRAFKNLTRPPLHGIPRVERSLRRALGAVAVATIGVAILETLSKAEQQELSGRTSRLVRADRDREVVDVYTVKKGKKKVTITTSPAKPKSQFVDDPAIKPQDDPGAQGDKPENKEPKPETKDDEATVVFEDLPEQTPCRSQTIEVADAGTTKSDAPRPDQTSKVVMCELKPDDWRPAKSRGVPAQP